MKKLVFSLACLVTTLLMTSGNVLAQDANEKVKTWVESAAVDIMQFDDSNYAQRKEENKKYFTESGYENFYMAMETAQMPEKVKNEQSALTSVLKCAAVVTDAEDGAGWTVKFPIELTYKSDTKMDTVIHNVTLHVAQSSSSAEGLGINQWIASSFGPTDTLPCATENSDVPVAPAATDDE